MARITVLITGGGAPGIAGTVYSLRNPWETREIRVVCVDMNAEAVGAHLADRFYRIPSAREPGFVDALIEVCTREGVDVVLPQVTAELPILASRKADLATLGIRVAVSDADAIDCANDKHQLADIARTLGVAVPQETLVSDWSTLAQAAAELGYPHVPFAVKQPRGNGMRGFRAVFAKLDRRRAFYEDKPDSSRVDLDDLHTMLGESFPPLMVMEYLGGLEHSVDLLADSERVYAVVPRERNQIRSGITFDARVVDQRQIIADSTTLAHGLRLTHAFGFQFKEDAKGQPKLLECNPRVQGTMVASTMAGANIIYGAVKLALGEPVPMLVPRWGTSFTRYWGGVAVTDGIVRRM
jgi:carbamoyl-phosphate synthase large subunit